MFSLTFYTHDVYVQRSVETVEFYYKHVYKIALPENVQLRCANCC